MAIYLEIESKIVFVTGLNEELTLVPECSTAPITTDLNLEQIIS